MVTVAQKGHTCKLKMLMQIKNVRSPALGKFQDSDQKTWNIRLPRWNFSNIIIEVNNSFSKTCLKCLKEGRGPSPPGHLELSRGTTWKWCLVIPNDFWREVWLTPATFQMLGEFCWLWTCVVFMMPQEYLNSTCASCQTQSFPVTCTKPSSRQVVSY